MEAPNGINRVCFDSEIYNFAAAQTIALCNNPEITTRIRNLALIHLMDCFVPPDGSLKEIAITPEIESFYLDKIKLIVHPFFEACIILHTVRANVDSGNAMKNYLLSLPFMKLASQFDSLVGLYFRHRFNWRMSSCDPAEELFILELSFELLKKALLIEPNSMTLLRAVWGTVEHSMYKGIVCDWTLYEHLHRFVELEPANIQLRQTSVYYFASVTGTTHFNRKTLKDFVEDSKYLMLCEPNKLAWTILSYVGNFEAYKRDHYFSPEETNEFYQTCLKNLKTIFERGHTSEPIINVFSLLIKMAKEITPELEQLVYIAPPVPESFPMEEIRSIIGMKQKKLL